MAICYRVSDTQLECCNPVVDACHFVDLKRSAKEVVKKEKEGDSGKSLFQRFLDLLAGRSSAK